MTGATAPLNLDVAVLAGGLGTRLSTLHPEIPKLLVPIRGVPFLDYLLDWLEQQGTRRVVLCLGHRSEKVEDHLRGSRSRRLGVIPSVEDQPRGTAGAIGFATQFLQTDPIIVMNGDSLVDISLRGLRDFHLASGADVSIACVKVDDASRYGRVEIDAGRRVRSFAEKDARQAAPAWISAGVYVIGGAQLLKLRQMKTGSMERDFLERQPPGGIAAFATEGAFIDIGTPESLHAADAFIESWQGGSRP